MRCRKEVLLLSIFLILSLSNVAQASLGLIPAKKEINFQSGLEKTFNYRVLTNDKEQELNLYTKGNLSKYVTLNKKKLVGGGGFKAVLKLPEKIEKPGRHRILIGVEEEIDEELAVVGTSLRIQAVIYVYVPYPGRYLEIKKFEADNANVGEPVQFKIELVNRGKEDLTIKPEIIVSSEQKKEKLNLESRHLESQENIRLRKELNTLGYNPGNYNASLFVYYGDKAEKKIRFMLGTLLVKIKNYTKKVETEGIQKFNVDVESRWNNEIKDVYALVGFENSTEFMKKIQTPSSNLRPWQEKTLSAFFDASNFSENVYDTNITLFYSGQTTQELGEVSFFKKDKIFITAIVSVVGAIVAIIGIIFIIFNSMKKKNEKKN